MVNSKRIGTQVRTTQRLGEILQHAHLVSPAQIEVALMEQAQQPERRLGEILARRGWLKQETADFFAQQWEALVAQSQTDSQSPLKQPLGYYLQSAALLDESQIRAIISEQEQGRLWVRLGAFAVLKGWLKQSTVDFFVENLFPEHLNESPFVKPKTEEE